MPSVRSAKMIALGRGAEKISPVEQEHLAVGRDHHIRRIGLAMRQYKVPRCCTRAHLAVRDLLSPIAYPRFVAAHDIRDVPTKWTSGAGSGDRTRQSVLQLIGKRKIERFHRHIGRHLSGVQCLDRLRKLLELFTCKPVAKVRSRFNEFGDHDRPASDAVDDVSAPTAGRRENELIARVAQLTGGFVVHGKVALAIATDTDPPRTGSIAPAVASSGNEGRGQVPRVVFGGEQLREFADIDRRVGQKHGSMLGRADSFSGDRLARGGLSFVCDVAT